MKPIQHASNNDLLLPPVGVSPSECQPLPITRLWYDRPGQCSVPGVVSFWQPTPEQLALLNAGKPIFLSFMGLTHPPVAIGVEGDGRF